LSAKFLKENRGMKRKTMIGVYGPWAAKLTGRGPAELSFRSKEFRSLAAWKKKARAGALEMIALPDERRGPRARPEKKYVYDGLQIEELSWQLPYGPRTAAVFVKPAGARGKLPGILGLHCHGGRKYFGKRKIVRTAKKRHPLIVEHHEHYYGGVAWATELARRGYAVLVHDAFTFASRRVRYSDVSKVLVGKRRDRNPENSKEIAEYNAWAGAHEQIMAKSLFSAGTTWPGVFLYEDQCALDVLSARRDVDSERIGCGGLSGGGLRTVFLAGLDERIKAAVCVGFMTTWRDYLLDKCHTHTWMAYVPRLPQYLDFPEILGLRVPLPTLVLNTREDGLYSLKEMRAAGRILKAVYAKAGAKDRFRCSFYSGGHKFDLPMQAEAFKWFDRWLKV
jgi:dienelactone hydrolase